MDGATARRNEPYRCTKCEVDIHSRVVKRKGDRKVESAIIFPTGHLRLFRINRDCRDCPLPHPPSRLFLSVFHPLFYPAWYFRDIFAVDILGHYHRASLRRAKCRFLDWASSILQVLLSTTPWVEIKLPCSNLPQKEIIIIYRIVV